MEKDICFAVSGNHERETLTVFFEKQIYFFFEDFNLKLLINLNMALDKSDKFRITQNYFSGPDRELQTKPMRVRS